MKILLMGDLHYPYLEQVDEEVLDAREKFFAGFLGEFLTIEADYHISLGDLTNQGHTEELEYVFRHINNSGRSFYHVLGNHDVYLQPKTNVFSITGQQRYHAVKSEEAHLVFLDTTREMDWKDWGGTIDAEQLSWLEQQVQESEDKPLLIFAHHPVYDTTARSHMDKLSIHPSIDMRRILGKKTGVGLYFNGHNHVHSIVNENQWHFVQTAACLDHPCFRMLELKQDEIKIHLIEAENYELLQHAPKVYNPMPYFNHTEECKGRSFDQVYTVSVPARAVK